MGKKIVVGVDASSESAAALDWARAVGAADDQIVVVHAWDIPVMSGYDMVVAVEVGEVEQLAKEGLDELVERTDDPRLVPVIAQGHAGRAIVAEGADADLIVVGHRGNSRLALMLGSIANYVVHHTERPTVVVRGEGAMPPKRVVVGVDDFDDPVDNASVRALRWAYGLPGVQHVVALHAWFLPPLAAGVFHDVSGEMSAMDEAAQRVSDRMVDAAGPAPEGVIVTAETARGTGSSALLEASRAADLVVVGRRGRGGFSELVLGSTTASTAAHSHAPVAILQ